MKKTLRRRLSCRRLDRPVPFSLLSLRLARSGSGPEAGGRGLVSLGTGAEGRIVD